MKTSGAPSKVIGVQIGEFRASYLQGVRLEAHFMLMTEEGPCGRITRDHNWSEKTMLALQALGEAMEEDLLPELFKEEQAEQVPQEPVSEDPPQF